MENQEHISFRGIGKGWGVGGSIPHQILQIILLSGGLRGEFSSLSLCLELEDVILPSANASYPCRCLLPPLAQSKVRFLWILLYISEVEYSSNTHCSSTVSHATSLRCASVHRLLATRMQALRVHTMFTLSPSSVL